MAPINNKNSKIETKDSFWNNFEEDYNKLDQETLNKKKKEMDKMFVKNQKKPDDNDFVYDVQEDFFPNKENEWDMEDEMDIIS